MVPINQTKRKKQQKKRQVKGSIFRSCGTVLSTPVLCGVDSGVPQLLQTLSESFDYVKGRE